MSLHRSHAAGGGLWIAVAIIAALAVGVPLALGAPLSFAFLVVADAVWLSGRRTRSALLTLGVLALIISARYIFLRSALPLSFELPETLPVLGLYAAELYAWIFLMLDLLQPASPPERRDAELQDEPENWPVIDLYVPTSDEHLSVVRDTVFAMLDMDYPADRFRVHILDEGHRPELQVLAREIGCGYLTRADAADAVTDEGDEPCGLVEHTTRAAA